MSSADGTINACERNRDADARLRAGEQLAEAGRRGADAQAEQALTFYHAVGATRYVHEGEELVAASA